MIDVIFAVMVSVGLLVWFCCWLRKMGNKQQRISNILSASLVLLGGLLLWQLDGDDGHFLLFQTGGVLMLGGVLLTILK